VPDAKADSTLARPLADLVGRTVVYTVPAPPRPSRRVSRYRPSRQRTIVGMAERRPATTATTVMRIAEHAVTIGTHPLADVVAPVIIQDLVARAIHARLLRPDRPFNTEGDLNAAAAIAQIHRKSIERLIRRLKLRGS